MISIPKGTKDVLPEDSYKWQYIEAAARKVAGLYNVLEIRTPAFEHTDLFLRGVGGTTDIVSKEMYTFLDKGGRSITLKPEGTAGAARAFIENNLSENIKPVKTFYFTPVFRYERPQNGRLREHHQFGIEVFGAANADTDAEVIAIAQDFLDALNVKGYKLFINSIGCRNCRQKYNDALVKYFSDKKDKMCPTCIERLDRNPLRVLDCKVPECGEHIKNAPSILDYICDECSGHFSELQSYLKLYGIDFEINPNIVRGLDYYTKTVFEFVSQNIGSQGTICGGGRYDALVESVGGKPTPAVGFGAGLERLLILLEATGVEIPKPEGVKVFIANAEASLFFKTMETVRIFRKCGISADCDHLQRSLKAQFKHADKINAVYTLVVGGSEVESGVYKLKRMSDGTEISGSIQKLIKEINSHA